MKKTGWIILGVIVVLVLWVFSGYNGMVGEQEKATTELSNMQAQYQRRADMMPQLAKIVKAYAKHEKVEADSPAAEAEEDSLAVPLAAAPSRAADPVEAGDG